MDLNEIFTAISRTRDINKVVVLKRRIRYVSDFETRKI